MSDGTPFSGYSPSIRITLELDGAAFDVAEVGPDHVTLRSPRECAPMRAVLIVNIDGRVKRRNVMLPEGIVAGRDRQPIICLETASFAKAS
jgi:hypothetical protein